MKYRFNVVLEVEAPNFEAADRKMDFTIEAILDQLPDGVELVESTDESDEEDGDEPT